MDHETEPPLDLIPELEFKCSADERGRWRVYCPEWRSEAFGATLTEALRKVSEDIDRNHALLISESVTTAEKMWSAATKEFRRKKSETRSRSRNSGFGLS